MGSDLQEIFRLAAKYFYKKYKKTGGSQAEIARSLGVTQSYVSAVMSGSRTASLDLLNNIANILYGPFDEFLAVGRRIQKNLEPEPDEKPKTDDSVENLIARLTYYVMDHQRIEKELGHTKTFYEEIVQNLQSGVIVTDSSDNIFFVNSMMSAITGIPPNRLLGLNILTLTEEFPGLEYTEFSQYYARAQKELQPLFYENIRIMTPEGNRVSLSGWLIPKSDDNNGTYDGMTCTIRDTTKSQELMMLLKMTLDNSPYAIGISKKRSGSGSHGTTYFTNKKMRQLFGQEEMAYSKITIQESLDRCEKFIVNRKEWRDFLHKHSEKNSKGSMVIKHTNSKKYRWSSENLMDSDGNPWGRMATVKEVGKGRRKGDN